MKNNNKKSKEIFCDISFFMKQSGRGGCSGCPKSRKCEEWNRDRNKRNSVNSSNNNAFYISDDK